MDKMETSGYEAETSCFYLFHYYFDQFTIKQIDGNIAPTQVKHNRFLYHENTYIIQLNSWFESFDLESIKGYLKKLIELHINPKEALRLTLYPELSTIGNPLPCRKTANTLGKWMMFFKKENDFDQKWLECCKLYDENKLTGIAALMCTTDYVNSNFDRDTGAIFFLCESEDISTLAEYAINLLKYIDYQGGKDPFNMYYKKYEDYNMDNKSIGKTWSYRINLSSYEIQEYYNY